MLKIESARIFEHWTLGILIWTPSSILWKGVSINIRYPVSLRRGPGFYSTPGINMNRHWYPMMPKEEKLAWISWKERWTLQADLTRKHYHSGPEKSRIPWMIEPPGNVWFRGAGSFRIIMQIKMTLIYTKIVTVNAYNGQTLLPNLIYTL